MLMRSESCRRLIYLAIATFLTALCSITSILFSNTIASASAPTKVKVVDSEALFFYIAGTEVIVSVLTIELSPRIRVAISVSFLVTTSLTWFTLAPISWTVFYAGSGIVVMSALPLYLEAL